MLFTSILCLIVLKTNSLWTTAQQIPQSLIPLLDRLETALMFFSTYFQTPLLSDFGNTHSVVKNYCVEDLENVQPVYSPMFSSNQVIPISTHCCCCCFQTPLPSEYEYRASGHKKMIKLPNRNDGLKPFVTLYSNCSLFVQIISFMDIEYADNDIGRFDGWMDCACE